MNDLKVAWDEFLERWPISTVQNMTLEQYV